jgi:hypothetical protein
VPNALKRCTRESRKKKRLAKGNAPAAAAAVAPSIKAVRTTRILLVRYKHLSRSTVVTAASPVECGQVCSLDCGHRSVSLDSDKEISNQATDPRRERWHDSIHTYGLQRKFLYPLSFDMKRKAAVIRREDALSTVVYSESCHIYHDNCRIFCKSQDAAGDLLYQRCVELNE